MSAEDAMQPRQFGPDGKYTTRMVGARHVEAVHTKSGRRVGAMNWFSTPVGATGLQNGEGIAILTGLTNSFGITNLSGASTYTLRAAGTLTTGRMYHTATVLPSGRRRSRSSLPSSDLYRYAFRSIISSNAERVAADSAL